MLSLVPTPIGNLGDISFRAIEVLKEGELILCEDTRVTKKLLSLLSEKYQIDFPKFEYISLHSHNEKEFVSNPNNIEQLKEKNCIYMSDAGMPCISDPGALLVDRCINNNIEYDVLPGANALLTAFAMSGFEQTTFSFFGFLPHKGTNRADKLFEVLSSSLTPILYESPHRLLKLLEEIATKEPERNLFLVKELSKKFQTTYKEKANELYATLKNTQIKGEWVVILEPKESVCSGVITEEDILKLSLPPKQKAKLLSKLTGKTTKEIYEELIDS